MTKIFIYGMLGLVILVAGMLMRTVRLTSKQVRVEAAVAIEVDGLKIASNLANALKFRTISSQDSAQFQAEAFLALHGYLEQTFPGVHAALTREVVEDYSLLYTWKGQKKDLEPILFMAHLDVVPVEPGTENDWTYPAFAGRIGEGFIWGRGAMDFKVAVTGILEAVELMIGQGFQPQRTIYLALGHDEEIGGKNGAAWLAELLGTNERISTENYEQIVRFFIDLFIFPIRTWRSEINTRETIIGDRVKPIRDQHQTKVGEYLL